ncbi:site-specific DNA-methyltransferase [Mucilaginibacter rubeus]|uniref:Methyltransferase n=1 Tax=Mucilaginibacter rubeus TaxID=2027860 RepID=A0AAE6MLJ7_9SPHI|nr:MULTISPECIES: site-specific DNA-methyltransferase [Mucilaginibacter]QEM07865.1 site-specific DNA-methyltransferase [Mucilaginibacter rubeus]QEM20317.1 site-specific DNA-methyltransferase [Mucilaginibacter gossypii]QTE42964.1 site-specific DNA-methyltransferase [Mucilaginibacter rubeus]QTE49565.1 site-specific DNA-methyltransferase [Mucilaginibacter rubeus]QTE54661.1 site-specific DNA-methyltransferase [Mucilaginibacter rubeus]
MKSLDDFLGKVSEGDCLEIMAEMPDNCIDMVLTDLPYGTTQNPWDISIDLQKLWKQYRRLLKPNGIVILTAHGRFTGELIMSNPGWYKYKLVWIKSKAPNFLQAKRQPLKKHEDILVFYPGSPVYHPQMTTGKPYGARTRSTTKSGCYGPYGNKENANNGARYPIDVIFLELDDWIYFKTAECEGKAVHPSQKPVALGQYLIRTYSNPGAVVLDNACGSGTFPVAAIREGRQFIAIEQNKNIFYLKDQPLDLISYCRARFAQEQVIYQQSIQNHE